MNTKHGAGLRLSDKKMAAAAAAIRQSEIMRAARVMLKEIKSPYQFSPFEQRLDGWLSKADEIIGMIVDRKFARKVGEAVD
jgi:hypothetical protein